MVVFNTLCNLWVFQLRIPQTIISQLNPRISYENWNLLHLEQYKCIILSFFLSTRHSAFYLISSFGIIISRSHSYEIKKYLVQLKWRTQYGGRCKDCECNIIIVGVCSGWLFVNSRAATRDTVDSQNYTYVYEEINLCETILMDVFILTPPVLFFNYTYILINTEA